MRTFILEDSHSRIVLFYEALGSDGLTVAKTVLKAKSRWDPPYDLVLLDYDLADEDYERPEKEDGTGTEFARWLVAAHDPSTARKVIIHSYNHAGRQRMYSTLAEAGWNVEQLPFGLTLLDRLRAGGDDHVL